jgi:capsular polysaccharide transport system permease protein
MAKVTDKNISGTVHASSQVGRQPDGESQLPSQTAGKVRNLAEMVMARDIRFLPAKQTRLEELELRLRDREHRLKQKADRTTAAPHPEEENLQKDLKEDPSSSSDLLSFPVRGRPISWATIISFLVAVVLPVLAVSSYYTFWASDIYVSEFRFAVRNAQSATEAQSGGAFAGLLPGSLSSNSADNFIVVDYLTSRAVVDELEKEIGITKLYSRPDIDWPSRFDQTLPIERFVDYWRRMVSAKYDPITGIATAEVHAFRPEDAQRISSLLWRLSEELVNRIANRAQMDAVKFAARELNQAEQNLERIRTRIAAFRNTEHVIDPQSGSVAANVTLAQSLKSYVSQLERELGSMKKQRVDANAPIYSSLQAQLNATRDQLKKVESEIRSAQDGNSPLSQVVRDYEALDLERQFAQTMVLQAKQKLADARYQAATQRIYATPYVAPTQPQSATYPKRALSIFMSFFICVIVWLVGLLVARSIGEHLP